MADKTAPKVVPQPLLSSLLGSETVILYVGLKRKAFTIHKDLLCSSSEFFRAGFSKNFTEGQEGVMYMPEDHTGAMALFIDWLYTENVRNGNTKSRLMDLYELYFLATKLMHVRLMDDIIDRIRDVSYDFNQFVELDLLGRIYECTPADSLLRKFGVDMYLFGLAWTRYAEEFIVKGLKPKTRVFEIPTNTPIDGRSVHAMSRHQLLQIWEATQNDCDLFMDIITALQNNQEYHGVIYHPGSREAREPYYGTGRSCTDEYHAHGEGGQLECFLAETKSVAAAENWIDDTTSA